MSVRRLAEPAYQPPAFAFNKAMAAQAKTWIKKYPKGREQSAVIPLLMLAQEQEGWVTRAAIEHVADTLAMPYIRVLEVATFYTQFQLKPVGTRAHVQVCGTTPCALRGAEELKEVCRNKIHHEQFHTNASGTLSWEEVECLGACVNAPMVMIFKDTYEDLTPERLAEIIDEFEAGKGAKVPTGPQIDRWFSAPESGFTSLADEKALKKGAKSKPAAAAKAPAAAVPPSNAAKPKTASEQASPAVKSPGKKAAEKPSLDHKDRPKGIERPAKTDDLKLISGVGPKIEKTLHSIGIFTYAQVASWKKAERDWVDGYLAFHGRIEREDWVKQAKALAKGGVEEYVRVFGKKPV
ncbi:MULTISPECIES: NADH-quinone oxidoreductase subunit NuoE [Mesorhizobium]|uniref:NADH-quinone oxidoreductase subunit NuoE n=1 Tax=Mesorhizobium denitrificans TaxID=2294114 RepID=A0A371XGF7_9HYPH|nr:MULTISPECIES: NADH-quinone oxidoreductase subunit NuoE [Mesorhizobium]RFC68124.1 NADH-quinone oxidoreductase subunit NuoE [Mesorhizobium denitrificans]